MGTMRPLLRCLLPFLLLSPAWGAVDAPEEVQEFCSKAEELCPEARALLKDVRVFTKRTEAACRKEGTCGLQEFDELNQRREELFERTRRLEESAQAKGALRGLVTTVLHSGKALVDFEAKGLENYCASLEARLDPLERETEELEALSRGPAQGLAERVRALALEGADVYESYQRLSLSVDYAHWVRYESARTLRERANQAALRIADMRDRLIFLQTVTAEPLSARIDLSQAFKSYEDQAPLQIADLGSKLKLKRSKKLLTLPESQDPLRTSFSLSEPRPASTRALLREPLLLSEPKKTLLDLPLGPPAPDKPQRAPEIRKAPANPVEAFMSFSGKNGPKAQADVLRRMGLTRTEGKPGDWAGQVHSQTGGTCAVVSQQQLLQIYGLVPCNSPSKVEAELKKEAVAKGFFGVDESDPARPRDLGTPVQFIGNLLQDRGLIVTKRTRASPAELDSAVARGKPVIVGVDAGVLWSDMRFLGGGHAILVTGLERSKVDGKVLGYYINDSGNNPVGAGQFIPAEQFLNAWKSRDSRYNEIR